jgi:hypothetical protein
MMGWPLGWTDLEGQVFAETREASLRTLRSSGPLEWWDREPTPRTQDPARPVPESAARLRMLGNGICSYTAGLAWATLAGRLADDGRWPPPEPVAAQEEDHR